MFIPLLQVGDKVILKRDLKVSYGTFTKGHEFTCLCRTRNRCSDFRGLDFIDADGNIIREIGVVGPSFEELFERK